MASDETGIVSIALRAQGSVRCLIMRRLGLVLVACASILQLGANSPEVVPLRVPASKVSTIFPAGTQLRGTSGEELEALIQAATEGIRRRSREKPPRLLRAKHFARWEAGSLVGRSELLVSNEGAHPAELTLSPWTLAIVPTVEKSNRLRMSDLGQTAVLVDPADTTITLSWQLQARPNSSGKGFSLGLPATETASFELELPVGWVPEGVEGIRQGPRDSGDAQRNTWRFDGKGGLLNLRLADRRDQGTAQIDTGAWVSGPTRIELEEASANWTTDWTVHLDPRGTRRFQVELDPGLEFLEVSGPGVEESHAEVVGSVTRVTVQFAAKLAGATSVRFRAFARVPAVGSWAIPAIRPLDCLWTGGRTSIRLDDTRVLADCREQAGRRVAPEPKEIAEGNLVVFEANAPRSVAQLQFSRPRADVSVEVLGQIELGNSAPRLEARCTWRLQRGVLLGLDVDLPPAWVPERVRFQGMSAAPAWHFESLPGGEVRVHVLPPSGDFSRTDLVLVLAATATFPGGRGPMSLPRVRPVGVRVSDERWVAKTEAGLTLQPTAARGLAWIDPRLVIGTSEREKSASSLREALAWRWISERGEARVERERVEAEATGSVVLVANLTRERLGLDWTIRVPRPQDSLRSVVLAVSDPVAPMQAWRFTEEASGLEIPFQPVSSAKRSPLNLPETAEAWELRLPHPAKGPVSIHGRLEVPWSGRGRIPLLTLADRPQSRNFILIRESREVRSSTVSDGLDTLDPSVTAESLEMMAEAMGESVLDPTRSRRRPAHAFSYPKLGGHLELRTERLDPASGDGVIDRALLTTFVDPAGPSRHCLNLRVASNGARALKISLPSGARLLRVRRDGQPLVPIEIENGISLPLNGLISTRGISTIALDYLTPQRDAGSDRLLQPERPRASMPYLGFRWEIVAPRTWRAEPVPGSLATADPAVPNSWIQKILGSWSTSWDPRPDRPTLDRNAVFESLDRQVVNSRLQEMTLGELLTRFDVGPWPIVVDAMALEAAGLGPKSKVSLPVAKAPATNAARSVLRSLGLMLVPVADMMLATTRAESPERLGGAFHQTGGRDAWSLPMRAATAWGSDASGRLQSVARWLGEVTPRSRLSGELVDFETLREGWRIWRFSAMGWPDRGLSVRLIDTRVYMAWRWGTMIAVLLAGIAARSLPRRLRIMSLAVTLAAGLLAASVSTQGRFPSVVSGVIVGSLAVLFYWIGRAWRGGDRARARPAGTSSSFARIPSALASLLAAVAGLGGLGDWDRPARAQAGIDRSILVLFPYEGQVDLARKPDRAILRLDDYEYLKALAGRPEPATRSVLAALGVTHRVIREPNHQLSLESEFELVASDASTSSWTVPVGDSRDLAATLDSVPVPVRIQESGRTAVVAVSGAGAHRLLIRRAVAARQTEQGESLSLPINPLAAARVVVNPGSESESVEIPQARGKVVTHEANVEADLGPIDRLEVRWRSKQGVRRVTPSGAVDGLILWDAEPAGDHVRARLTYRNPEGTSRIRLRLQPGMILRPATLPGLLDAIWQGTPEHPEWVASVEPPLPDGATVQLEFWRSREPSKAIESASARRLPVIEPVGVERYSGALGFRRPADWMGRLSTLGGSESITEEAFVRAWGNLPEEPLTLSGATRFSRAPELSIVAGPPLDRPSVQPDVALTIGPGRIGFDMKVDLREPSGTTSQLAFEVPPGLRVISVEGDGLTAWSREGDRLRFRFDGATAPQRLIQIRGWVAVVSDPLSTITTNQEIAVPWPRWIDAKVRPGTLSIAGTTPFHLATQAGVVPLDVNSTEASEASTLPHRKTFRVSLAEGLGKLRWELEPARVGVQIRSHMTIHPDWAEWVAMLRYEVSGGACDVVHLKLPSAWAASAELTIAGDTHQLTSEARGPTTFWAIRPERPFWGSQQLIVRATRPITLGEPLAFPDLTPLGRGSADTYLAITNASGREIATEGSPGVQPIDDRNQFLDDVFTILPRAHESVFQVRSTAWSLKVIPSKDARTTGSDARPARVALADLGCEVMGDGSVLGLARYEVEPRSGTFLPIELPPGAEPLWTSVNNLSERALKSSSGQWVIPIDEAAASQVSLIWRGTALAEKPPNSRYRPVSLPSLTQAKEPTLLTVRAAASVRLSTVDRRLVSVSHDRIETEKAEWLKRSIQEELSKIDRGSLRDRARLMSALVRFELILRSADRAAAWDPSPLNAQESWVENLRHRLRLIRSSLLEPMEMAGLEEFARRVQVHLGQLPQGTEDPPVEIPEPTAPVRLPHAGEPQYFLVQDAAREQPRPTPLLKAELKRNGDASSDESNLVLASIVAPLMVCGLLSERLRVRGLGSLATAGALLLLGVAGGPLLLVAAIAFVFLGRYC